MLPHSFLRWLFFPFGVWGGALVVSGATDRTAVAAAESGSVGLFDLSAWHSALLNSIRAETTAPCLAARNLALFYRGLSAVQARPDADVVVMSCAAEELAGLLFPGRRAAFAALTAPAISGLAERQTAWAGASSLVRATLASRAGDGATRSVTYVPRTSPGSWIRTPPTFRPPELPQWGDVTPFVPAAVATYVQMSGPPDLASQAFIQACEEISSLGAKVSPNRTVDQTEAAHFWSDFSYTGTPVGHWNEIAFDLFAQRRLPDQEMVRLLAVFNTALSDGAIACWKAKYHHHFWRPVTCLAGPSGGQWEPLLNTPPHPDYPSGHSVFSGVAVGVLRTVLGTDEVNFTARSDRLPGVSRTFSRLSDCAREISSSRVWGGIHFRFACEDGLVLGEAVAAEVMAAMVEDVRALQSAGGASQ